MAHIAVPAHMVPYLKSQLASEKGNQKKFLFYTWGGLGDQVCAEPTLRYALKQFDECEISLASECPDLFTHLKFKEVFDLKKVRPIDENYHVFHTNVGSDHLFWQYFNHCLTHPIDFSSACAINRQLPNIDKEIQLAGSSDPLPQYSDIDWNNSVVVHPGKHWASKTFPKAWWDAVLGEMISKKLVPILIGKDTDDNRSTVDVETKGCVDLRNKTSIKELISVLKLAQVVITNDSSPLHIAASGEAWIGFIASCKHPDHITHWRLGTWSWRMQNLGLDGAWNYINPNPGHYSEEEEITIEKLPPGVMEKILPSPETVADWARDKLY